MICCLLRKLLLKRLKSCSSFLCNNSPTTTMPNTNAPASNVSPVIHEVELETVGEFIDLMKRLRQIRRDIVAKLIQNHHEHEDLDHSVVTSFENVEKSLRSHLKSANSFQSDFLVDHIHLTFNIKDELLGVRKDLDFLNDHFHHEGEDEEGRFIKHLSQYHPIDTVHFNAETAQATKLLKRAAYKDAKIDYFITDWDGTFKTYCSNYTTCMQPAYSGVVLAKFVAHRVRFAAVLTAGPLRDPGILDLISMPLSVVNVGGSWGREWSLANNPQKSVVEKSCFTDQNRVLFEKLSHDVSTLLNSEKYSQFKMVGSGFQRKVDRITIGVQDVSGDVPKEKIDCFLKAIDQIQIKIDPLGEVFHVDKNGLDVEIALKSAANKQPWSKADGLTFVKNHLDLKIDANSSIVVCGDTVSDLCMVEFFTMRNFNIFVIFVNPSIEAADKLKSMMVKTPDNVCIVGCPEVMHAAMLNVLKHE